MNNEPQYAQSDIYIHIYKLMYVNVKWPQFFQYMTTCHCIGDWPIE